jgi:tetratricopeptide (TPR) repeat protein
VDEATLTDASLLIGLARYDEADRVLRQLLEHAEATGDDDLASHALEGLGTMATRRGYEAEALALFERSLTCAGSPDPVEREGLYVNVARLRSFLGDAPGAVALLEDCVARLSSQPERDPEAIAHFTITLSNAYTDLGDYGRATTVLAGLLADGAEDLDLRLRRRIYNALARVSVNTGRSDQAVQYAEKMLELTLESGIGDIFDTYLMCAHARLDAGDTGPAGEHLEQARRNAPHPMSSVDEGFLLVEESRHALQQGDHDLALDRARGAVELLADGSVAGLLGLAYLVIARVYDETGELDRAERAYRMAIDNLKRQGGWPVDLAKAYRRYGKFLRRIGKPDAALEMLELASETGL